MMELVIAYSKRSLYDAESDIVSCLKRVQSRFSENITIDVHPANIEVRCSAGTFPWLFYAELGKEAKIFSAQNSSSEPLFAAVPIAENVCLINRYILLP